MEPALVSQPLLTESSGKTTQRIARRELHSASTRSFQSGTDPFLQLQRTLGNYRVAQLIKAKRLTPEGRIIGGRIPGLQPKLTVGAADDQYEQEADRVARQVVTMPDPVATDSLQQAHQLEGEAGQAQSRTLQSKPLPLVASITPFVQRQMGDEEQLEEEKDQEEDREGLLQGKFFNKSAALPLQRQPVIEEKEPEPMRTKRLIQRDDLPEEDKDKIQTKRSIAAITPVLQRQIENNEEPKDEEAEPIQAKPPISLSDSFETGEDVESRLSRSKGSGSPLPDPVRNYMEPRFGMDFSHVRIHTGADSIQMNRDVGAQAFTHGSDIYYGASSSPSNLELTAHELTHVVQQTDRFRGRQPIVPQRKYSEDLISSELGRRVLRRDCDPSTTSCPPEQGPSSSASCDPTTASCSPENVESARQTYQVTRSQLLEQDEVDPQSTVFGQYASAYDTLTSAGEAPGDEPQGILLPSDRMVAVDELGQIHLLSGEDVVGIGEDLFPALDDIADSSQSGRLPSIIPGPPEQVLLWQDGRAVLTPPVSGDLATLLIQGNPAELETAVTIGRLDRPWEGVRNAGIHSLFTSGLYQLGSHPLSRFSGVALPAGSRIRFAHIGRLMSGQMETRLITIFRPGTNKYYAWDAHLPVGMKPHNYWHVNQQGMSAGLFGQADHSAMTASQIAQARTLKYVRVGGRVLFVVGVLVDGYQLYRSAEQSVEQGTPRPVVAQAIRVVGGWGGAWAGAKLGCAGGALAGAETGPGLVLTCIAGGVIGGVAGYAGADWIADMISED